MGEDQRVQVEGKASFPKPPAENLGHRVVAVHLAPDTFCIQTSFSSMASRWPEEQAEAIGGNLAGSWEPLGHGRTRCAWPHFPPGLTPPSPVPTPFFQEYLLASPPVFTGISLLDPPLSHHCTRSFCPSFSPSGFSPRPHDGGGPGPRAEVTEKSCPGRGLVVSPASVSPVPSWGACRGVKAAPVARRKPPPVQPAVPCRRLFQLPPHHSVGALPSFLPHPPYF